MAIKFTENDGKGKPAKRETGGKTYVAEEPAAGQADPASELPFAKPARAEKKGPKIKNRPPAKGKTPAA